jgi:hypothetical protein
MRRLVLCFSTISVCLLLIFGCSSTNTVSNPPLSGSGKAIIYLPNISSTGLAKTLGIDTAGVFELRICGPDMDTMVYSWNLNSIPTMPVTINNIPAGYSRLFIGRIIDGNRITEYEGSAYADIYPDQTVTVYLRLSKMPGNGGAIICVEIEGYTSPCSPSSTCDTVILGDSSCATAESLWQMALDYCAQRGATPSSLEFLDSCPIPGGPAYYRWVRFVACWPTPVPPPERGCYDTVWFSDNGICHDTSYWYAQAYAYSQTHNSTLTQMVGYDACDSIMFPLGYYSRMAFVFQCDVMPPFPPDTNTLQLLSPNGGERFYTGDTIPITWLSNASATCMIYISFDQANWMPVSDLITSSPSGYNEFSWVVTDTFAGYPTASSSCRIMIAENSWPEAKDFSDSAFTIIRKGILTVPCDGLPLHLNSPNGGELYHIGDTLIIDWCADRSLMFANRLMISVNNGRTWQAIPGADSVSVSPAGQNHFFWIIPRTLNRTRMVSQICRISVRDYSGIYEDVSDSLFVIQP